MKSNLGTMACLGITVSSVLLFQTWVLAEPLYPMTATSPRIYLQLESGEYELVAYAQADHRLDADPATAPIEGWEAGARLDPSADDKQLRQIDREIYKKVGDEWVVAGIIWTMEDPTLDELGKAPRESVSQPPFNVYKSLNNDKNMTRAGYLLEVDSNDASYQIELDVYRETEAIFAEAAYDDSIEMPDNDDVPKIDPAVGVVNIQTAPWFEGVDERGEQFVQYYINGEDREGNPVEGFVSAHMFDYAAHMTGAALLLLMD